MTQRLYQDDPELLDFEAVVVARREHQGRPAVVLDRTAFYPESGGQPWDLGRLDDVGVTAVVEHAHEVLHVLERPIEAGRVRGRVDAARRRDHMQQHHGQHLLSRAFLEVASAVTVSFHLGRDECTIDLDRLVDAPQVRRAEAKANQVIWQGRPVHARRVSRSEAAGLGVSLPPDGAEDVRIVEAEGFDLQACCGTHPRRSCEVGMLLVLGSERHKGGSRVRFVCGGRALDAARDRIEACERLGERLSARPEGLADAAQALLQRVAGAERALRQQREDALALEARSLLEGAAGDPPVVAAILAGRDPGELRLLAQHLTATRPCVALLASRAEKTHLVFARSASLDVDIGALLQEALRSIGGRGGGRGDLVQGGSDNADGLEAALETAAARLRHRGMP